jgi:hypothetical protein
MGIDLSATQVASPSFFGSYKSWIKCARCTERLQHVYPVERMELEGGEDAKLMSSRFRMVVLVDCHGERMRCAIEIPRWWGEGMRMQALAYVYAFVRGKNGTYRCEVRRGYSGRPAGALATEVT